MSKKQNYQYEYYRCIFCNHKGEWQTVYIRSQGFMPTVEYLRDKPELWIIKEVSNILANMELMGKLIEGEDLDEPTVLYPVNQTNKKKHERKPA